MDGAENRRLSAWANTLPAVLINVQRQPGANVIAVVDRVQALLPQLTASLPSTLQVSVISDRTGTIRASVRDVQRELIFAVALVVMVTFLFLRNIPATIIPSVVVPLSLVGTFGVMYLAGFSINNLTLMALTIATGFVVDDAIVMVENIARHLEEGEPPLEAALIGAREIGFTLVSLTISLIAVLIPLLFMADVVGRLFREFAITLAVSILISAGRVADAHADDERAAVASGERAREQVVLPKVRGHHRSADRRIRPAAAVGAAHISRSRCWSPSATLGLTVGLYLVVPKGFFPVQDTGAIQAITEAPQSISFAAMAERQQAAAKVILGEPDVVGLSSFIGVDGNNATLNSGSMLITLAPHDHRTRTASEVIATLRTRLRAGAWHHALSAAGAGPDHRRPREPHAVPVHPRGSRRRSPEQWVPRLIDRLKQRPSCRMSRVTCRTAVCRPTSISIAMPPSRLGVSVSAIDDALYDAFGQRLISTIYTQANQYRVVLEAAPQLPDRPGRPASDSRRDRRRAAGAALEHRDRGAALHARSSSTTPVSSRR